MDFIHGRTLLQCLIHCEVALTGRRCQHVQQLILRLCLQLSNMAKTITASLQASDGLLEGFLVVLTDAHNLANGAHLGAKLVFHTLELFKCPTGKLNNNIISVRNILIQRSVLSARNLGKLQARCQHCADKCDRKTSRLGCQCGGTRGSRVNLNNDDPVAYGIMRKLYVRTTDDLNGFYDAVCIVLQSCLQLLRNRQHGSCTEGISSVYAHGIDVLDKADGDEVVVSITNDLQLQLFPAENGFLNQNLSY